MGVESGVLATCRMVNVTGTSNVEVVARGVDGLEVYELTAQGVWQQLATLSAFSDANGWNQEKYWSSIQYSNLDGSASGQQEVVARGPNGVVVYKYDTTANQWVQLPSTNQLDLTDDPWGSNPSYYDTFRLGDASGDGRQDTLIARGPYGIRTWFYGRSGQTGWSDYLPSGYPDFTGAQQAAYTAASQLPAVQALLQPVGATGIRDFWTAENPPSSDSLASLQSTLASAAGCSGQQTYAPPQYPSCTPPASSTGFTAQDWTTVVNELLAEAWDAQRVVNFYAELDNIRQKLFIAEGAELPAIAGKLNLSAATNTSTAFNLVGFSSAVLGIAASVSFEFPEVSAALWVASEISSMLPSASPDLTNNFDGTYNQLQNVFAAGISQTEKALASQSLQVRSTRICRTWLRSCASAAPGRWTTSGCRAPATRASPFDLQDADAAPVLALQVTDCQNTDTDMCTGPAAGPGVVGSGQTFQVIGLPPNPGNSGTNWHSSPCDTDSNTGGSDRLYQALIP